MPSDAAIGQIFDRSGGELLILGEPGSGKTTLLLELARDLLARAEKDKEHHIPVILNLSSWAIKRQSISNWLVEELNTKYQVPRKLGLFWVENDQMLLLLDGLDEVIQEQRAACVEALNAFRQEHDVPMVVCSRRGEYLTSTARLALRTVVVQPLTDQQIDAYLSSVGEPLAELRNALRVNSTLRDLATSPLMLSVLSLTYQGRAVDHFLDEADLTLQQRIFSTYVQRMLQRRGGDASYSPQQTLRWLRWLAQQLIQHNQTEFYLERMQPDWLADQRSQQHYLGLAVKWPRSLIIGLSVGITIGPLYSGTDLLGWVTGLLGALAFIFIGWWFDGGGVEEVPSETSAWDRVGAGVVLGGLGGAILGGGAGLIYTILTQGLSSLLTLGTLDQPSAIGAGVVYALQR